MARFSVSLGQCSFCGVSTKRGSRLVGDPRRPDRICRACVLLLTEVPKTLPPLDELPERVVEVPELPSGGTEQRTAGKVLREFQRAVETQLGSADLEARINLGIAYFEMGLLDEAIREWEIASGDPAFHAECLALTARARRGRGDVGRSIECLLAALKSAGDTEAQRAAFFFELSLSLEAAGRTEEAAKARAQARAIDPDYAKFSPEPDMRFFRNAREAFATGGSRDAFRFSDTPEPPMAPGVVIAALEAWLRAHPEGLSERATLAARLLTSGRRLEGAHHFLLLGEALRSGGDPVHAMAAFQRCVAAMCPSASPLARRALAELHRENLPDEHPTTDELERFRCSFCDTPPNFQRPPAHSDGTVICADCLDLARARFSE